MTAQQGHPISRDNHWKLLVGSVGTFSGWPRTTTTGTLSPPRCGVQAVTERSARAEVALLGGALQLLAQGVEGLGLAVDAGEEVGEEVAEEGQVVRDQLWGDGVRHAVQHDAHLLLGHCSGGGGSRHTTDKHICCRQ